MAWSMKSIFYDSPYWAAYFDGKQTKDPPRQKALTRQKTLLDKRPSDKTPSDKRPSYELFFWNGGGSFVQADGQKALLTTKEKRPSGF